MWQSISKARIIPGGDGRNFKHAQLFDPVRMNL